MRTVSGSREVIRGSPPQLTAGSLSHPNRSTDPQSQDQDGEDDGPKTSDHTQISENNLSLAIDAAVG